MNYLTMVGDSVFDNGAYIAPQELNVGAQLDEVLGPEWALQFLAVDGSVTDDVRSQCKNVSSVTTHLVVSSGGNDALGHLELLAAPTSRIGDAIVQLREVVDLFRAAYRSLLLELGQLNLPTTVCTIYNPNGLEPAEVQRAAEAALPLFNDVIISEALSAGFDVLDLRAVFVDSEDYANPIEPSSRGGLKLARIITDTLTGATQNYVRVWG